MPERYTPPVRLRLEMGRYVLGGGLRARDWQGASSCSAKSTPRWRSTTR